MRHRTGTGTRFAIIVVTLLALLARTREADAARVWIAWAPSVATCKSFGEDFFACLLGATNFSRYSDDASWTGGRAVTFGGTFRLTTACSAVQSSGSATVANDTATFNCIERQARFPIASGDIMLYYPPSTLCENGRNHWSIPVTNTAGTAVRVNVGLMYSGTNCRCETAMGHHELYEAASRYDSADCCNGQLGCTANPQWGWYNFTCGGTTFLAEEMSPNAGSYRTASACVQLSVDTRSICAQPRATRTAGRCSGNTFEECDFAPTTRDCGALGCRTSPMPHCVRFGADCTLTYPHEMCAGESADATVTCTNTGTDPWGAMLSLGVVPSTASPFADSTWISPTVADYVTPGTVNVGAMGTFRVRLHAPNVTTATTITQQFALREGTMDYIDPTPAMLEMQIAVSACGMDGGVSDAGIPDASTSMDGALPMFPDVAVRDARSDIGGDGSHPPAQMPGCGCRTATTTDDSSRGLAVLAIAALAVASRRRRRGGR